MQIKQDALSGSRVLINSAGLVEELKLKRK